MIQDRVIMLSKLEVLRLEVRGGTRSRAPLVTWTSSKRFRADTGRQLRICVARGLSVSADGETRR
jgi:hypothetical protein